MSDQPMQGPQWLQYWPGEYETQRQVEAEEPPREPAEVVPDDPQRADAPPSEYDTGPT